MAGLVEGQDELAAGADELVMLAQRLTSNPTEAMAMLGMACGEVLCHIMQKPEARRKAAVAFGAMVADFAEIAAEARKDPNLLRPT
jgi:hypothetical protein